MPLLRSLGRHGTAVSTNMPRLRRFPPASLKAVARSRYRFSLATGLPPWWTFAALRLCVFAFKQIKRTNKPISANGFNAKAHRREDAKKNRDVARLSSCLLPNLCHARMGI